MTTEKQPVPIRVVIAEDQAMFLGALAALLNGERDIVVVAQARNGKEAIAAVFREKPDILIADIEMPEVNGLEVAAEVKSRGLAVRTIILTTFARPGYMQRAIDSGALGYLLKDRPVKELADAIRRVHMGLRAVDPDLASEACFEKDPLTEREREILKLASRGLPSSAIARHLRIAEGTVRNHLSEAIQKLGASNRTQAAQIAHDKGWL